MRALRSLAFAKSHTSDIHSWAYRQALSALLMQRKYSIYDRIGKQARSACYKLMDRIEEISVLVRNPGPERPDALETPRVHRQELPHEPAHAEHARPQQAEEDEEAGHLV